MDAQYSRVAYCPGCGRSLTATASFVQEFWVASETVHFCWCSACFWRGEVKQVARIIGIEPAADDEGDDGALSEFDELESLFNRS